VGFDVHENVIRMSLLKAPMQTDKWADFGIRKFDYRVVFHEGGFESSNIIKLSDEMVVPVVTAEGRPRGDGLPATSEFVVVDDDNAILETLKLAFDYDGFICRFYESAGGSRRTTVTFPLLESVAWEVTVVDLRERPMNGSNVRKLDSSALSFELTLTAFELVTVLIRRPTEIGAIVRSQK
jgi:alpha-mannosidase